jgi:hypothetical protein
MYEIIGIILILDAILSIMFVEDKKLLWQIGRIIRYILGLILIIF